MLVLSEITNKKKKKTNNEDFQLEFSIGSYLYQKEYSAARDEVINYFTKQAEPHYLHKDVQFVLINRFINQNEMVSLTSDQIKSFSFLNDLPDLSKSTLNKGIFRQKLKELSIKNLILPSEFLSIFIPLILTLKNEAKLTFSQQVRLYQFLTYYEIYYAEFDSLLNSLEGFAENLEINCLTTFQDQISFLNDLGILKLSDLQKFNLDALLCVFYENINDVLHNLRAFSVNILNDISRELNYIKTQITPIQLEILLLRNGYSFSNKLTLDDIGKQKKVTRERIRQIEHKGLEKIKKIFTRKEITFTSIIYQQAYKSGDYYVEEKSLRSLITNREDYIIFKLLIEKYSIYITLSKKLDFFYFSDHLNEEKLEENFVKKHGFYLTNKHFENFDSLLQKKMKTIYKKTNGGFIYKKFSLKNLIIDIIKNHFTEGYHISYPGDYEVLKNHFQNLYGIESLTQFPSQRSLVGFIDRSNFIQVDRGTYNHAKNCVQLNDSTKKNLLNFIKESKLVLYYRSLFTEFEEELVKQGITNHYYLKGVLDPLIKDKSTIYRDYIKTSPFQSSALDSIRDLIQKQKGIYSIDLIAEKFPGVKSYVYMNVLYQEEEKGLIWINSKEFVYSKNININSNTLKKLKIFIENIFAETQGDVISSRKIYGRMAYKDPVLLKSLIPIKDQYGLFSLMKWFFKEQYFFRRPKIAKNEKALIDPLRNYLLTQDYFDKNLVENFLESRGFYININYLELIEEMSEEFVQVSKDKMVNKRVINISENDIFSIEKNVDGILRILKQMDIKTINDFKFYPTLKQSWNSYLLLGIIRSYLENKFNILNQGSMYDRTNFIITKK